MFDFHFVYADGTTYDVTGITKVVIQTASATQEINGDAILTCQFPLRTMYLFSPDKNVTISGNNLIAIDVLKKGS